MINRKAIYESQLNKARSQFILLSENDRAWYDYALDRKTESDWLDNILDRTEMGAAVAGLGGTAVALGGAAATATGVGAPVGIPAAAIGTGVEVASDVADIIHAIARGGQAAYYATLGNNPEKAKESLAAAGVNAVSAIPFFGGGAQAARIAKAGVKALNASDTAADAARAMTKGERVAKTAVATSQAAEVAADASKISKGVEAGKELAVIPKGQRGVEAGKQLARTADAGKVITRTADVGKDLARGSKLGRLARTGTGLALGGLAASALLNQLTGPQSGLSTEQLGELEKNNPYADIKLGSLGVGQFDPGEATKSVSAVLPQERTGRGSRQFSAPAMGIFDPDDPNYYRRSSRALAQGLTEDKSIDLYKRIKHNVNSYLKSKEGEELNSHIEKIKQEIDI